MQTFSRYTELFGSSRGWNKRPVLPAVQRMVSFLDAASGFQELPYIFAKGTICFFEQQPAASRLPTGLVVLTILQKVFGSPLLVSTEEFTNQIVAFDKLLIDTIQQHSLSLASPDLEKAKYALSEEMAFQIQEIHKTLKRPVSVVCFENLLALQLGPAVPCVTSESFVERAIRFAQMLSETSIAFH